LNKEQLEQLQYLKLEVKHLQEELKSGPPTTDSVKGSMDEFPYIEHTIKIYGADESRARKLRAKLEKKLKKLQDLIAEMEEWLDTVDESEMRTILRLTYRNGLTQSEIGAEIGYDRSVVSRKLKVFWENQEKETSHGEN
jgi:DNA-directed RNA polymerase specialized sigma subunit